MIKKVFRPFWSYDVIETEQWLSKMSSAGFILLSVNFARRIFTFEKTQPQNITYHISFDKSGNGLTLNLERSGWETVLKNSRWAIYKNSNAQIEYYSSRYNITEKIRKTSKIASIVLTIIGCYYGMILLI